MKLALVAIMVSAGALFVDPATAAPSPDLPAGRAPQDHPGLRKLVMRFDRNHDGRLEPGERRQAIRALRRTVRALERRPARPTGRARRRQVIQRYDLNGDGNVGPAEMPPVMRQRLRPLDRNRDGWVDGGDQ